MFILIGYGIFSVAMIYLCYDTDTFWKIYNKIYELGSKKK